MDNITKIHIPAKTDKAICYAPSMHPFSNIATHRVLRAKAKAPNPTN